MQVEKRLVRPKRDSKSSRKKLVSIVGVLSHNQMEVSNLGRYVRGGITSNGVSRPLGSSAHLRVFPSGQLNPRPASFLRCLGTVGRWRRSRCTVSAGSLTM